MWCFFLSSQTHPPWSRWLVASWSSSRGEGCHGDDDDGGDGVAVVYDDGVAAAVAAGGGEARGGEWVWGSGRSGDGDPFWCWPEKPAGKLFRRRRGGGGRNPAAGEGCRNSWGGRE
ncbi:hypothetical protein Tco_1094123 [Tanacetum coccineum]|uniref:Uncharacterized protein n=1 Tax=Tanacetum coccineum TaxID=301880 RepID=A0ABQ5IF54_9ASTR